MKNSLQLKSVLTCLALSAGGSAPAAPHDSIYTDENRAPLGRDARQRVEEMEGSEYNRPHFRMPDAAYRVQWEQLRNRPVPQWLETSHDTLTAKVLGVPKRTDVPHPIQEQLIIELCSK